MATTAASAATTMDQARGRGLTRFQRYLLTKFIWFLAAFWVALVLNFFLPRLIPGNPVDTIIARLASGGLEGQAAKQVYEAYVRKFGLDQPAWVQFWLYVQNLAHGDLGTSFLLSAPVRDI